MPNPRNPYSDSLLADALLGSLSNAESLARGFAVAPVGLLGDINALGREYLTPRLPRQIQSLLETAPSAPTTEQILANIPRASQRRMETSGMEQFGAAMNPMGPIELAGAAERGAMAAGRAGERYAEKVVPQIMERGGLPAQLLGDLSQGSVARMVPDASILGQSKTVPVSSLSDIENKFKDIALDVYEKNGTINLSRIVVPKEMRSSGIGSSAMSDLTSYADQTGQKMALTPSGDFGGNVKRLKDFYKQFGFVENKGKNKDFSTMEAMIRLPEIRKEPKEITNLLD